MKGYRVHLFGTFKCTYNGKMLDRTPTGKLQLLFVYLLLHMNTPIDRKELSYLFWPESTDHQAQTNLRKLLYHLKNMLPSADEYLMVEDGQIMWKSEKGCWVDTVQFMEMAGGNKRPDLFKAESLYRGQLLTGVHADWLIERREQFALQYTQVIQELVAACQRKREYTKAIHYANKLLQYDPLAENTHIRIMRLHLLNGNRSAAIHQYEKLQSLMSEQLGIKPSQETIDLYSQCISPNFDPLSLSNDPNHPFIGRYQEWASLQRLWGQKRMEMSCFVLIEGEKGMGKTHLLEQFSHWVAIQGATVRMSRCYPSKKHIPYEAVIQWLEDIDVSALAESCVSEIARIRPSLRKLFPDLPSPAAIDDPWKLRYFYEALEEALISSAKSLVLVIDDWQWVDEETLSFLEYLRRPEGKIPLFIVVGERINNQERSGTARTFGSNQGNRAQFHCIRLNPMSETDTKQLIDNLYLPSNEKDVRNIYAVSGGNPLYIQELFLAANGEESSGSSDATLRELMIQRLSSIPSSYRKVMDGLAVLGAAASLPLLMKVVSMSEKLIQESVDFLCQLRFLKQTERGLIEFFHDTIREASMSMISPAQKTLLHAKIAEAMQAHEPQGGYMAAEIAYHYDLSGNPMIAAPYYEKAVARANELFDHDQAIDYAQRLLEIYPEEKSCSPLSWLAHAHLMRGDLQQADSHFRQFLQKCGDMISLEETAFIRIQLARCIRLQGNYFEALEMLQSARRQLEWLNDRPGLIEVYRQLTTAYIHLGQFKQAHDHLELSRGDQTERKEECHYLGLKADYLYEKGMYAEALDYYQQQIQLANRVDARIPLLGALFGMSLTYMETDQYAYAFESIVECIRLTRSVGDQTGLGLAIGILGKIYLRAGWVQEALPCLHYGLQQAQQSGDKRSVAILSGLYGYAMNIIGNSKDGFRKLIEAEQMSAELHFPLFHGNSLYYLAHAYCAEENWTEAERCLNAALQMMERDGRSDLLCKVRLLLLKCELAKRKISTVEAISQLREWLSQYPLRKDQVLMYFTLWKWSDAEDIRMEAERLITGAYKAMPIPNYWGFMNDMKLIPEATMMKPPPLPEEVSSIVDEVKRGFGSW